MNHIYALFFCLMASASPTLAETDPVPYEDFLAENDISFTASEVLDEYRSNGCEENEGVRDYRPIRLRSLWMTHAHAIQKREKKRVTFIKHINTGLRRTA